MQVNTDRERYLELLHSGELWTRRTERKQREDFTPLFDRQTEDSLDAIDQKPSRFEMYFAGLLNGVIFGAFIAWLIFGRGAS